MGSNSVASILSRLRALAGAGCALVASTGIVAAQDKDFVDLPHYGQMNLHHPVTETMDKLVSLHNLLLVIITVITVFVLALMIYVMVRFRASRNPVPSQVTHNTLLEVAWTVLPIVIQQTKVGGWRGTSAIYFSRVAEWRQERAGGKGRHGARRRL